MAINKHTEFRYKVWHYTYLTSYAFVNPWQDRFETRYDFVPSKLMIDHLLTTGTQDYLTWLILRRYPDHMLV